VIKLINILTELNVKNVKYKNDKTGKQELGKGAHFVYIGRQRVGVFHVDSIGTIPFDPKNWLKMKGKGSPTKNTIFMFGGMAIMFSGQGVGRNLIKTIFKDNKNIKHITLYTTDDALGFWKKLGGEILGEFDGKYYVKIDRI